MEKESLSMVQLQKTIICQAFFALAQGESESVGQKVVGIANMTSQHSNFLLELIWDSGVFIYYVSEFELEKG